MTGTERITIRIPKETADQLQILADSKEYSNISDVIRSAIDGFLEERRSPENVHRVKVELPRVKVLELEELVKEGDSISMDDAIRNAVREYTRTRVGKHIRED